MSLTVNGSRSSNIAPIEAGTHLAICTMLIDLGEQFSEAYHNSSRKVLIGWEIPGETIELDDGPHPRTITKRYTASLNEKANLRQDLAAWRGRDFTPQELAAFDLRNVVGAPCFINVAHRENANGRTYANVQSVMALPKGTPKPQASEAPVIFDMDTDPLGMVEDLPEWIANIIKESTTYKERLLAQSQPEFTEALPDEDDGDLPF